MNERHFQHLSAAVWLGFLAEDVVFAAGCALRGEAFDEAGRQALGQAGELLKAVAEPKRGVRGGAGHHGLSARGAVSALEAELRLTSPDTLREDAKRLAKVIEHALNGGIADNEKGQLEEVRRQFAALARTSLSEVSSLSDSRRTRRLWSTQTELTSISSSG
jgi:hypothetical protein